MSLNRLFQVLLAWAMLVLAAAPAAAQLPGLPSTKSAEPTTTAEPAVQPSLDDLIRILENDDTRAKLVQSLKAAAYTAPKPGAEDAAVADEEVTAGSLPAELAVYTRAVIGGLIMSWNHVSGAFSDARELLSGTAAIDLPRVGRAILPVCLVIAVVFTTLMGSRLLKAPLLRRIGAHAVGAGPIFKLSLLFLSTIVDLAAVLASWAAGYAAAVAAFGDRPSLNQALFLNAFLLIEVIKVGLTAFVSPHQPKLRLTPFGDSHARYWHAWIARLISLVGYTFLFVAPVVQRNSSLSAANAVRFIVAFAALLLVFWLILKNRQVVAARLKRARQRGDTGIAARINALLGDIWWVLAIGFSLAVFSTWLSSPEDGLAFLAEASLRSVAAMAIGGLIVSVLTRLIVRGIPIPAATREKLPMLAPRVNSFIPNALTVIRVLVIIAVLGVILDAWSILEVREWARSSMGQRVIGGIIGAGIVIITGFAFFLAVSSWVEYRLNPNFGTVPTARERTLLALFRNGFTITLVVIVVMLVLSQLGIDIGPLLAGAGVVGLAVGFGAQKLVQDIITGAFIQIENALNEGDVVQVAGVSGVVERLTIRSLALRALDGTYHLIPFSSVDQVANMTKDFSQFVVDLGVGYREDTAEVKVAMSDAFEELRQGEHGPEIIADFEMFGVNELGSSSVIVRGRIKTLPGKQWGAGRAYNEIVKRICDERGIEIAFPNMTLWFGEDKRGTAPALRLASEKQAALADKVAAPVEDVSRHGSVNPDGTPIPPDIDDLHDDTDR
ncbi:mechanosensitive ion channel domain-containing protein [Mangrovicella endophytica]|uniref:mechanosensitive ion channel domain-containing protein n=1 Tax=Mangrovicella endophytica TaxID=2066697 RepID=UPI000C9DD1F1|nr:mechanosensitive ion channel domain-containing protein [Mangrovicella endophytica]